MLLYNEVMKLVKSKKKRPLKILAFGILINYRIYHLLKMDYNAVNWVEISLRKQKIGGLVSSCVFNDPGEIVCFRLD